MSKRQLPSESSNATKRSRSSQPTFRLAVSNNTRRAILNASTRGPSRVTTLTRKTNGRGGERKSRSHPVIEPTTTVVEPTITQPTQELAESSDNVQVKQKRKRDTRTATKLEQWLAFRDEFLDELLRHDGHGDFHGHQCCSVCGDPHDVLYKCQDCSNGVLLRCKVCIVKDHSASPFHRIEGWNGVFFDKTSLRALGLRVQLGHGGSACASPVAGPINFTALHITGIHHLALDFCDCRADGPVHHRIQLLRAGWFPVTFNRPQTVITFDCLNFFHELSLQSKINAYDFYHTLMRLTDNCELAKRVYYYADFNRVFRIWKHLQMLKRAGRGQDPGGATGTSQGGLCVECPACPHPDKNLPTGWESVSPSLRFLYILYLAVDANFKLKNRDRGFKDIELAPGWGSFVEESRYQRHLADYVDQPEINTCESQHDAIVQANNRSMPGHAVSGAGLVLCSRHSLVRKNGVGDLKGGESYSHVDYIIFSALIGILLPLIILTYDIGCQWSKNYRKRMEKFPDDYKIPMDTKLEVGIPSWHINGHGQGCRNNFALAYMPGAGQTCGEEVEGSWAHTNPLGPSTRQMGLGARHEALNDHWNSWNFRKTIGFRPLFLKRLKDAITMRNKHADIFGRFSATFPVDIVKVWESMVVTWESDHTKPNPYEEPSSATTLQDVRRQLSEEEATSAASGSTRAHQVTTLTAFLTVALDLEEQQRVLQLEASQTKGHRTSKQVADLQDKRNSLMRRISNWRRIQAVYMPDVSSMVEPTTPTDEIEPPPLQAESLPLYLPSSLPSALRQSPTMHTITDMERRLRVAQADDALADLRRQRRIITGLWQFKRLNVSGTGNKPNTRMRSLYNRFNHKTQRIAERYRAAYAALLILEPGGSWTTRLRKLNPGDIRGPGKEDDDGTSNGRYVPSWIWLVQRVVTAPDMGETEAQFNESMRVEWAKSRARKFRWREEVLIIQEEMRRVIVYYEWKASWWKSQCSRRHTTDTDTDILHGIDAYAEKQANLCNRLAESCACVWLPMLKKEGLEPEWESRYVHMLKPVTGTREKMAEEEESDDDDDDWAEDEDEESEDINDPYEWED